MKNLKHFTTKEIIETIQKIITIKIDKTIKHLDQEHLHVTTKGNSNPKLDITRIPAIKMVHSCDVKFVTVFIIWLSNAQKSMILTTQKRLCCTIQILTILTN